jgi:hypothetical protein
MRRLIPPFLFLTQVIAWMVQASEYEDRRQKVMVDNAEVFELKTSTHSQTSSIDCWTVLWYISPMY